MSKRIRHSAVIICLILIPLYVRSATAQETSTPEERTRWVEITRKLEMKPLDADNRQQGEWALKRVMEVHDVHVPLCGPILTGLVSSKYEFRGEITRQLLLASAAYIIEHPDGTVDQRALNVSALESVLKTYKAILATEPKAKSKELDEILKKQEQGKLPEYVDVTGKSCVTEPAT